MPRDEPEVSTSSMRLTDSRAVGNAMAEGRHLEATGPYRQPGKGFRMGLGDDSTLRGTVRSWR